jgi:hypothetical protein
MREEMYRSMRFMMLTMRDSSYEAGQPPSPALVEAVVRHVQDMTKAGVLLASGGLLPTSQGVRVKSSGDRVTVIDGPFRGAMTPIDGFAIIQVRSREEAVEWAKRFVDLHLEYGVEDVECEIRPLLEG